MANDDKPLLVLTPQLQMAVCMLAMSQVELFAMVAEWRAAHPGAIADLAPGEPDPLAEEEREAAVESGIPAWAFVDEAPLPAIEPAPDVWVFGNPPQARANPAATPRVQAIFDEQTITRSAADVREASWLARALRQRAKTQEKVVAAIVQVRPRLAIATDPAAVDAVTVREIASAIGMHESTVTRVVTACRYQTIHGLVELVERSGKLTSRAVTTSGT